MLEESYRQTETLQDRRRKSELLLHYARLHTLRGDIPAARAALIEAIDLFERMDMRRELTEARQALRELEAEATSSEDTAPA